MIGREDSRDAGMFADFDAGYPENGASVVAMMLKRRGKSCGSLSLRTAQQEPAIRRREMGGQRQDTSAVETE